MSYTNNIAGWICDIELQWLYSTAKEMETIIEVGSWKGRSTHALLSGCPGTVWAVDHWLGSKDDEGQLEAKDHDIFEVFKQNVGHFENLKIIKAYSIEAAKQFEERSVDMVFIDGDHSYEEVKDDIAAWLPKAKKLICVHDYCWPSVRQAIVEAFGLPVFCMIQFGSSGWMGSEAKMPGEIGYLTIAEADFYFSTRLFADAWADIAPTSGDPIKTAALTTAYERLYFSGLFNLPLFLDATADQLVVLKKAQCELSLYMLIHLADEDRRKGLQAQGVTVAGIVKEQYSEADLNYLPIPPFVAGLLEEFSTAIINPFYISKIDRDEDEDSMKL